MESHIMRMSRWMVMAALVVLAAAPGCSDGETAKGTNAPCLTNSDCASHICHGQICGARDPKDVGEPCTGDGECRSFNCRTPKCAPGVRANGDKCLHYLECASKKCLNNLCVTLGSPDGGTPAPDRGVDTLPPDALALKAPVSFTVSAGDKQVVLAWAPVTGATSYNLYWKTTPGVTPTTGSKVQGVNSPYTHTGLSNGQIYYYVVTAVAGSVESPPSAEGSASPKAGPTLSAPTGLTVKAGDKKTTVDWSPVSGATGYNLYWGMTSGVTKATGTKISPAQPPYSHTGLINGKKYYYVVTAYSPTKESVESKEASAVPAAGSAYGSVTSSLSKGAYGLISLTNTYSGGGKIEVYVFTGDPKISGKAIIGLTVVAPTGSAVTGALTGNSKTGAYAGTTTSPLAAGTYVFKVSGGVSGTISATVLTVPTCAVTKPTSGSTHTKGTNLTIQWKSTGSQRATYLLTDNKGTVTPLKPIEPDVGGVIINGKDIPYASPLQIKITSAWSAKATPNTGGIVFGAEGYTKITLQ